MSATLEYLPQILAAALRIPVSAVRDDLKMGDVEQWDSVSHLDLIMQIETAFGVAFSAEEMLELTSLPALRARLAAGA